MRTGTGLNEAAKRRKNFFIKSESICPRGELSGNPGENIASSQPRAKFSLVSKRFVARIASRLCRKVYICRNG